MKVEINKKIEETVRVIITLNGKEFRMHENNEGKLVINKCDLENGDDTIIINPSVSNEIRLS